MPRPSLPPVGAEAPSATEQTAVSHGQHVLTSTAACNRLTRQHGGEQSGLVSLTFDLLTSKVVSDSRVTWTTSVPILVFLGLSVLDLGIDVRDIQTDRRQTDVRQKHRLMPSPIKGGGIISSIRHMTRVKVSTSEVW